MTAPNHDLVKKTLQRLIEQSDARFTVDDVISEFRLPKDRSSNRKLLTILKVLGKYQPNAGTHIFEVNQVLGRKDSFDCLLQFLNHFSDPKILPPARKDFLIPLLCSAKIVDNVTLEHATEIKERVVQAATDGLSKSARGISSESNSTTPLFPALSKSTSPTLWDFPNVDMIPFQKNNIASLPIANQENHLLYDLIYSLSGIRGSYVYPEENTTGGQELGKITFKISNDVHISLRDTAVEILPMATYHLTIQKFIRIVSDVHCGQVLQALSAALRTFMNEYYLMLNQFEKELIAGSLTLHKMVFYIRPSLKTMEMLTATVLSICTAELRGGKVLTLLYNKINSLIGDIESQKILVQLTQKAAVPYMEILRLWIQKGVINDPKQEFLVQDNEVIHREEIPQHYSADYWEKRYSIRRERIPCFLAKVADIILRTGKYLNVIRQCGKNVLPPQVMNFQFTPLNENHTTVIEKAYRFASKTLLEVLLKENDLMGHLMFVKRHLLLHQGDFITQFMDSCEEELLKNVDQMLPVKLENLLGLTLRLSSAKHDPCSDFLHCELLTYDLVTQMSKIISKEEEYWHSSERIDLIGLECFAFRYEVEWPVSLVLNHIAISKYQMLFRQLFYCKHVERQLCKVWKENCAAAKKFSYQSAEKYRPAFTLRQRMMNAVQNLEYYMMIEIIEPNWHIFIENMSKVENVDDVLDVHQDFLDLCLRNCMLTDPQLLRSIIKLCNICLRFCEFIQKSKEEVSKQESLPTVNDYETLLKTDDDISCQSESAKSLTKTFSERVARFELEFTGLIIGLLKQINCVASDNPSDKFINLARRINFNSFYNEQMEKLCAKDSMPTAQQRHCEI